MSEQISLSLLEDNPFNPRINYSHGEVEDLAVSMEHYGLLVPVKVRKLSEKFQLVFGHRRARAARLLKWKEIRAEVGNFSDEELLSLSFAENESRKSLSDFEKGLYFKRMSEEFGKTYEEIGNLVGYTKEHVCNYIRMTRLFDKETILHDKQLSAGLMQISEHHARILAQIDDPKDRLIALQITISERLSVREVQKMIRSFRSWFRKSTSDNQQGVSDSHAREHFSIPLNPNTESSESGEDASNSSDDIQAITRVLFAQLKFARDHDFESFIDLHAYRSGFSLYGCFSSEDLLENSEALDNEKIWFYSVVPHFTIRMRDMHIRVFDSVALATAYADYKTKDSNGIEGMTLRGTIVLTRELDGWKIFHEHWSTIQKAGGKPEESRSTTEKVVPGQLATGLSISTKLIH